MATRVERHASAVILIVIMFILTSGCLQDKSASGAPNEVTQTPAATERAWTTAIERVSIELDLLNSEGWSTLAGDLNRPRTTTLLWYHLKKIIKYEPKVVFGNPDKMNTALAIPVKTGGNSTFPVMRIKGVDYYIIDPVTPEIVSEFDYGYMYDDPGSVPPGFFNDFRLNTDDIAIVEQWMKDTGASLYYTDFPSK